MSALTAYCQEAHFAAIEGQHREAIELHEHCVAAEWCGCKCHGVDA